MKMKTTFLTCTLVLASQQAVHSNELVLFSTGFEASEGYREADLIGQNGWTGFGSGGNGIVVDFFEDLGQQAYIGFDPPLDGDYFLGVVQPLGLDPLTERSPVVHFSVIMEIVDSTFERYDCFRWSIYNSNEDRLFCLDFDNTTLDISYALGEGGSFVGTGFSFEHGGNYQLGMALDYSDNSWSAFLNDELIVEDQAIAPPGILLDLGDITPVWVVQNTDEPGDNFMLFDEYTITLQIESPPPVIVQMIDRLADGRSVLRIYGSPGQRYDLEASTNLKDWFSIKTFVAPETDGVFDYVDMTSVDESSLFYRTRSSIIR